MTFCDSREMSLSDSGHPVMADFVDDFLAGLSSILFGAQLCIFKTSWRVLEIRNCHTTNDCSNTNPQRSFVVL
jgi:hypothetical protein